MTYAVAWLPVGDVFAPFVTTWPRGSLTDADLIAGPYDTREEAFAHRDDAGVE